MSTTDDTASLTTYFGPTLTPPAAALLLSMQHLYAITPADLFYKWESYSIALGLEAGIAITPELVREFKREVQMALESEVRAGKGVGMGAGAGGTKRKLEREREGAGAGAGAGRKYAAVGSEGGVAGASGAGNGAAGASLVGGVSSLAIRTPAGVGVQTAPV